MHTNEIQKLQWLNAMLTDEKRRAMLRALLAQYELPVIQIGRQNRSQIRGGRTAPQNFNRVKSAAT